MLFTPNRKTILFKKSMWGSDPFRVLYCRPIVDQLYYPFTFVVMRCCDRKTILFQSSCFKAAPWMGLCLMPHASCLLPHASCFMHHAHVPHASSCAACIMLMGLCIMQRASGLCLTCTMHQMHQVSAPCSCASCVMRQVSCVMHHASGVMRHASGVMHHASCVRCIRSLPHMLFSLFLNNIVFLLGVKEHANVFGHHHDI